MLFLILIKELVSSIIDRRITHGKKPNGLPLSYIIMWCDFTWWNWIWLNQEGICG
jgi:hypothetical protein